MISRIMMLIVIGTMYATPAVPSTINKERAASGPYAAELRASNQKTGIPASGASFSPLSSEELSGRPKSTSIADIKNSPPEKKTVPHSNSSPLRIGNAPCWSQMGKTLLEQVCGRANFDLRIKDRIRGGLRYNFT